MMMTTRSRSSERPVVLTGCERATLTRLVDGQTQAAIAAEDGVGRPVVHRRLQRIRRKLAAASDVTAWGNTPRIMRLDDVERELLIVFVEVRRRELRELERLMRQAPDARRHLAFVFR